MKPKKGGYYDTPPIGRWSLVFLYQTISKKSEKKCKIVLDNVLYMY